MAEKKEKRHQETSSNLLVFKAFLAQVGLRRFIDSFAPPQIMLNQGASEFPGMKRIRPKEEVTVVRR